MSRLDIQLEDGTRDDEFLKAVTRAVTRAFEFGPSIVFYQSGVDGLASDKLGRMQLSHEGLMARDRILFDACVAAGVPCVIVLGGGYFDPIELTVQAHTNTFCLASDLMPTRNTAVS